jgi:hypothetical protein
VICVEISATEAEYEGLGGTDLLLRILRSVRKPVDVSGD